MIIKRTGIGIWLFLAVSGLGIGSFSAFDNFYFHSIGYSVAMIGALTATFNISVAVAEIPAAIVFDRKPHWLAIQVGSALRFLGLILFFLALGPLGDFTAEVMAGVGAAAMSGTSIAYILNRMGAVDDHERRRTIAAITVLGAATSLLGGAIGLVGFSHSPRLVWGLGALFMAAAGICFFFGRPPALDVNDRSSESLRSYLGGLYAVSRHPRAWLSICADAALVAPFLLWQLRLGSTSLMAVLLGFAVMKVAGVLGGQLMGHRTVNRGALYLLLPLNILAILGFAAFDDVWLIISCFGLHVMFHIAISIYCQSEFQSVITDSQRAGAGSVVSLLSSFVTGGAAVLVGLLADIGGALPAVIPSVTLYLGVALIASRSRVSGEQSGGPPVTHNS